MKASSNLLSLGSVCNRWNCAPNSLRRWADEGQIACVVRPSGHRYFKLVDCLSFFEGVQQGESVANGSLPVAILARVSSSKQGAGYDVKQGKNKVEGESSDLDRQVERLRLYAKENYACQNPELYADIGSGLSFTRPHFLKLVDDILAGKFRGGVVLVTYKERACRYGFELLEKVANFGDCQIVATEKEIESEDETADLTNDLVSIMTCFSAKIYGKRGGKSRRVELAPETITRMMELRATGMKVKQIAEKLNEEGFRTVKGNPISKSTVRRVCDSNGSERLVSAVVRTASYVRKGTINPALWAKDALIPMENGRVTLKDVGRAYRAYCEKQGKEPVNNIALGKALGKAYPRGKYQQEAGIVGWVLKG